MRIRDSKFSRPPQFRSRIFSLLFQVSASPLLTKGMLREEELEQYSGDFQDELDDQEQEYLASEDGGILGEGGISTNYGNLAI